MYLQINTAKYDADLEITNIYENSQILWSQFFTDMLLFVYIQSTSNIYIGLSVFRFVANKYKHLFGHIRLFIILGQVFDEWTQR